MQALPQVPQLLLSVRVLKQAPEHEEKPRSHVMLQLLFLQLLLPLAMALQAAPQAPQLAGSVLVSTQALPQRMVGKLHWKPHVPRHTGLAFAGAEQTVPQAPQLEVSQPQCDPVSRRSSRRKWISSSRASTSRV